MRNRSFFWGVLLLIEGTFGVEKYDVTMTVMEGDSVTLNPGETKIPEDDTIQWWFGNKIIARMNKGANIISTSEGDYAGFKDRLKLNDQTGSLTITDTRTTDSGNYKLIIKSTAETFEIFKVTVRGVVKYVTIMTVMEGDSVTLNPGDTKIPEDDTIQWLYGNKIIAYMNKGANIISTSEGDYAGFKDRLKLNDQTGSLTITDTRTTDSGEYKLLIKSTIETYVTFKVTVREQDTTDRKTLIGIIVVLVLLLLVGAIAGFVIYRKKGTQPGSYRATAGEQNGSAKESGETEVL
ncbi:uncharacterized protein LOC113099123 [Carassius auratus]|uniref:Uncharacterized protein LOC113099123 n=1 Tax=Carassius auratus TaxID=7957 RepID=A0A6P6PH34_CARAU|nr:uncharacterized protein LOC113099123 [Carassius auratus]